MLNALVAFLEFVMLVGVIGGALDLAVMEKKARHFIWIRNFFEEPFLSVLAPLAPIIN